MKRALLTSNSNDDGTLKPRLSILAAHISTHLVSDNFEIRLYERNLRNTSVGI